MDFKEENDELGRSFLERMYFEEWKKDVKDRSGNRTSLELDSHFDCNLDCKYCYVAKYGDELYPDEDDSTLYENAEKVMEWLVENGMNPSLELFAGEPLVKDVNFEILEMIFQKFEDVEKSPPDIVIPTNFTWVKSDKYLEKVEELMVKSREAGMPVHLSASIDGKYCADNRPPIDFTEEDYEKIFDFAKEWNCGFHPMIYSEEIENWKDNWRWFQEKFDEYGMPFNNIYLLEVRNREWSKEQINEFGEFLKWLIDWTVYKVGKERLLDFIFDDGYNILSHSFCTVGRGIGCSIQSTVFLRLADLGIGPCHRLSYDQFMLAELVEEDGKIEDVDVKKPELLIGHTAFHNEYQPMCEKCTINKLCTGQCLGAMYEYTGDIFSPVPNVCRLEYKKVASLIEKFRELGLLKKLKFRVNDAKEVQIENLEELI